MKKISLILAVICCLSLTACSSSNTDDQVATQLKEMKTSMEIIQQDINSINAANKDTTTKDSLDAAPENETDISDSKAMISESDKKIEVLNKKITDLTAKIDSTTIVTDKEKKLKQFLGFNKDIKAIEIEIDLLDDTMESNYRSNKLSRSQYDIYEKQLDQMEDQLDNLEEHLEIIFKYN